MLNNIVKYTTGACLASFVALSANAGTMDKLRLAEKRATPVFNAEKNTPKQDHKYKSLDGHNFFMVKGGVARPVQSLEEGSNLKTPKPAYTVGVLVGRECMDGRLVLDLEYMNRGSSKASVTKDDDTITWKLKSNAVMVNASLNLIKDSTITPYLRAGVGVSRNQSSDHTIVYSAIDYISHPGKIRNQFAWQAGLGLNFDHNSMVSTVLEYMYVDHGKFSTQSSRTSVDEEETIISAATPITGKLKDHVITVGIKFNF